MKHAGLTIGGFTQPFVARNLVDVQANVEKGLCQRFLWLVPEPNLVTYEQMCKVNEEFTTGIGESSPQLILYPPAQFVMCSFLYSQSYVQPLGVRSH